MDVARDLHVLLREALLRVHHDEHHVRPPDGGQGTDDAVPLDGLVLHGALPADAGGVHQNIGLPVQGEGGVHRVPGGAGDVGDDAPLLA